MTDPQKRTQNHSARRRSGWGLLDTLMLGYLTVLVVGAAVAYAASERFFYFWDFAVYQDIATNVSDGFRDSWGEGLRRTGASLSNDYNAIFAMPIMPVARMFGTARPIFLGCLAFFYQVPFILAVAAVARQVFWGQPRRVFWIAALTAALMPALWAPMLRGYPDAGGAALFLVAVWLQLVSLREGGSLRKAAGAGVYLAAATLFRRHYAYAVVAFFITVVAYRTIVTALAYRQLSPRAGRELRYAAAEVVVMGAAALATLVAFGSTFLQYLMAANYYTLYASYLNPPLANLDYFVRIYGGGLCVLSGLGWIVTWRTHAARTAPALFCMLYGIVSGLLWVLVVRQVGPHLGLHITLLVMPGLVGLVLAGARLQYRPARLAFLTGASGFFVVNMLQSLAPWQPPQAWPTGSLFSDRYPALSRSDDREVQRLVSYLRSLARPADPVYVEGSSVTMNYDILRHADRVSQPFGGPTLSMQTTPQVDSRDWYPIEELVKARFVVITSPLQFHMSPIEQDVVRLSHDIFTRDWEFAGDFSATPERFHLQRRAEARVFVRTREADLARSLRLVRDMRRWMRSRPLGPPPVWVAMTPGAFWSDGPKTSLRAVFAPGRERQALLYSNPDWHGSRLTATVRILGNSRPPVRITASAVDMDTGAERVLDSQVVTQLLPGPSRVLLQTSAADAGAGSLLLSVEATGDSFVTEITEIAIE